MQDALWRHATAVLDEVGRPGGVAQATVRFDSVACGLLGEVPAGAGQSATDVTLAGETRRKYHRSRKPMGPRTWRTRADPFAEVAEELQADLEASPAITSKELLTLLQARHPGEYADGQLRTLQRRVSEWRTRAVVRFTDPWTDVEHLSGAVLPAPLTATTVPDGYEAADAVSVVPAGVGTE